ncbi:BT_2262 family domain-containing protein [Jiulongibacter sediminis]|uniref:BT-2262-like C-terminal domain-containing protein n=1 Tax=Jiulongibacter sediminis TaxID=1605367 RepID=A0A0P7BVW3_9BACT|nr:BT_2262 family domain-containing protein [Jiulongibacter sediminis]KPM48783.1 hypothetical protein AFM12_09390 [Jiulongibacter sediminis]TBX25315.1 hypothetical protein TK44_09395 [Jiulongibacter sediminis]
MKKISLLSIFGLFLFASCEQDFGITESEITYLPLIELKGPAVVEINCGDSYSADAYSATAFEGGSEIQLNETITGAYFGASTVSGPDYYEIAYSAVNKDGIPGSSFRQIYWKPCPGDLSAGDISGAYTSTVVRNGSSSPQYTDMGPVYIVKDGDSYKISDAIGGYYDFGRGYGWHYAGTGMMVTDNGNGTYSSGQTIGVGDFGGELVLDSFSVDPATGVIKFSTSWSFGYVFDVTLTPNN